MHATQLNSSQLINLYLITEPEIMPMKMLG